MLVQFNSSETAEVLMFAETAKMLLDLIGKETTARGTFTPAEMLPAAQALRKAVQDAGRPPEDDDEEAVDEATGMKKIPPVGLGQRAWPLIDMLERTAKSGKEAHITWEAATDF